MANNTAAAFRQPSKAPLAASKVKYEPDCGEFSPDARIVLRGLVTFQQGTHMTMGGMIVVKAGNKGIQYMFSENFWGDRPPLNKVGINKQYIHPMPNCMKLVTNVLHESLCMLRTKGLLFIVQLCFCLVACGNIYLLQA